MVAVHSDDSFLVAYIILALLIRKLNALLAISKRVVRGGAW
jgi:hypothetical protein